MAKTLKEAVSTIKNAYNIVDVITGYGIQLKHKGGSWLGLCPFHNEKTPSFTVSENFQNYHCWGCSASGDLLSFVERTENISFYDALIKLAEDKNIELELDVKGKETFDYQSIREALKETANFFYQEFRKLPESHAAKQEVLSRGLSLKKMLYGYAPEGRDTLYKLLKSKGFTDEVILHTGAVKKSDSGKFYDFWNGRLMFFITDLFNRPIGFSGRKLFETDSRGKYVNSPDGPMFDKSSVLFNSFKAKTKSAEVKKIFVSEGQFDVASFIEAGLENVVASSGTAFTTSHAKLIDRFVGEDGKIVLAFDGDEAGISAIKKIFKNIPFIHSKSTVLIFPEGMDPCDYRLKNGNEKFLEFVENNQTPLIDFILSEEQKKYNLNDSIENSNFVNSSISILSLITNKVLREKYITKVALESFTSVDTIKEILNKNNIKEYDDREIEKNEEENEKSDSERNYLEETEEDSLTLEEFKKYLKKDKKYRITSNLIKLVFNTPEFYSDFKELNKVIPSKMNSISEDLSKIDFSHPILPELFKDSHIVKCIIEESLSSYENKMSFEDKKELFDYLSDQLHKIYDTSVSNQVRKKIMGVLEGSKNSGASMLRKAIQTEQAGLKQING